MLGIVRPGTGVREWREDGFGLDLVPAAERAHPDEGAGGRLMQGPACLSLQGVVVAAQRCQVGGDGAGSGVHTVSESGAGGAS